MNLEGIERDLIQKAMAQAQNNKRWRRSCLGFLEVSSTYGSSAMASIGARARLLTVVRPAGGRLLGSDQAVRFSSEPSAVRLAWD